MRAGLVIAVVALAMSLPSTSSSQSATSRQITGDTTSETITVQAGQTANGTMQLQPGVTYHAVMSGSIRRDFGGSSRYEIHDPFYCYDDNVPMGQDPGQCPQGGSQPSQEFVAFAAYYGQGSSDCVNRNGSSIQPCDLGLGASKGVPLPYEPSHSYEQDFTVGQPGTLKVAADRICPAGGAYKCVSGSFTVQISQKTKPAVCKAPWAAHTRAASRATGHAAAVNEVHVVAVCPDVQFHKGGTPADAWLPCEKDTILKAGDEISTDPDGQVTLAFADNSTVVVSDTTQLTIGSFFTSGGVVKTEILLKMGRVAAMVNKSEATKSDFRIKSPTAVSSVRGTVFSVFYDPGSHATVTSTNRGAVKVTPSNHKLRPVTVHPGREVEVTKSSKSRLAPIGKAGARGGVGIATARSLVFAALAPHTTACATSTPRTNAFSVRPAKGGWLVTVKLQGRVNGKSRWRVKRTKVKPANTLARFVAGGCR